MPGNRYFPEPESRSMLEKVVAGFASTVRRMVHSRPPGELGEWPHGPSIQPPDPDDDSGLAGSRVPRRPPDRSDSGAVALNPDDDDRP
jgi:hypothetical protein